MTFGILFNNAGATPFDPPLESTTAAAWDHVQSLLLRSTALGMHYAIAHMKAAGGTIVNTASVAALGTGWGPFAYSVAKVGVLHLTRMAAAELSAYGVRVNSICPGFILTGIHTAASNEPPELTAAKRRRLEEMAPKAQPLRRVGTPDDIAQACLFLASERARFVTGANIVVDGGMTLGTRESWDRDLQAQHAAATETWLADAVAAAGVGG